MWNRFGVQFMDQIANPGEIVKFYRRRQPETTRTYWIFFTFKIAPFLVIEVLLILEYALYLSLVQVTALQEMRTTKRAKKWLSTRTPSRTSCAETFEKRHRFASSSFPLNLQSSSFLGVSDPQLHLLKNTKTWPF